MYRRSRSGEKSEAIQRKISCVLTQREKIQKKKSIYFCVVVRENVFSVSDFTNLLSSSLLSSSS